MTPLARARRVNPTDRTDAECLQALAQGDLAALGTLYDRHARDVWRVLSRVMSGSGDVDDVLHATFLALPKLASHFDGRASCKNWLCGIATRLALRHGRGLRRFTAMLTRFGSRERPSPVSPETEAGHREDLRTLDAAIAALSPKKRAVFVLIEIEGLGHEDVAKALEIPMATVRTRLFGAKEQLRDALRVRQREGGAP